MTILSPSVVNVHEHFFSDINDEISDLSVPQIHPGCCRTETPLLMTMTSDNFTIEDQ
jgi:hypothetical protein